LLYAFPLENNQWEGATASRRDTLHKSSPRAGSRLFLLKCFEGTTPNNKAVSPSTFDNTRLVLILEILWLNRFDGWYLEVVEPRPNC
jgi:hypothetical protein